MPTLRTFYRQTLDRIGASVKRFGRLVRAPLWFPHLPLAILLAVGGVELLQVDVGADWSLYLAEVLSGHRTLRPSQFPKLLIGVGTLIMALGLVLRSRVAWVMALMLATAACASLLFGHGPGNPSLLNYFILILVALLGTKHFFNRSSITASTLFALASVIMLLLYATLGVYYLGSEFKPAITDLVTALYYAVVTISTVGYGDITPQTADAKLFTISVIVLGVTVFATSLTAIVTPIVSGSLQKFVNRDFKRMKRENHYVVIGNTEMAINTWRELVNRGQAVTRVVHESTEADPAEADIVAGEYDSVEVLRRAGADKAVAVLAMLDDDSENAFIVLAVRELPSRARTVVAVNDARNLSRIRLVQPDVVIAPQILGGELAAMIACGEEVTSDFIRRRVLNEEMAP